MSTYFITGANGFVGRHLINYLCLKNPHDKIIATGRSIIPNVEGNIFYQNLDLYNYEDILECLAQDYPDYVIHLAAESSVSYSWKYPIISFNDNVNIFLNLIEAIRESNVPCRVLSVGSSESYGKLDGNDLPIDESTNLSPTSPYAAARVSQELLSRVYIEGFGMDIVMTRSFNHFGPGQDDRFVIASFIKQILSRKNSNSRKPIETGDLSIIRDFVDVRDVVIAYIDLLTMGKSGEIYNICSGIGRSLSDILEEIQSVVNYSVICQINQNYIRPTDNSILIGSNKKIKKSIGWKPQRTFKDSLIDTINDFSDKNENTI